MTPSPRRRQSLEVRGAAGFRPLTSGTGPRSTSPSRPSSIAPSRVAPVRVLDELDHLPVGDEIPLGVGRVGKEAAGDPQLAPIGSCRLLGDPRAVDPPLSNQTYRGLDLRAGAITEPLELAATDFKRFLWIDLAHAHIILSHSDRFGESARCALARLNWRAPARAAARAPHAAAHRRSGRLRARPASQLVAGSTGRRSARRVRSWRRRRP